MGMRCCLPMPMSSVILSSILRTVLVMGRFLVGCILSKSFKTMVEPAHNLLEQFNATLKVEHRAGVVDQSILEIGDGLFLEGYLGFKFDTNACAVFTNHDVGWLMWVEHW